MPTPARITLRLLGRFAATADDGAARLLQISAPMRRGLIAYLAMQPGMTETRERLATLMWGERADKQARQNLRQCLMQLRKEFEPSGSVPLLVDRDSVGLDPAVVIVDARELGTLAQSDDLDDLERAVGLVGGEFLDGGHLDLEPFDDWLRSERARIAAVAALTFEKYAARQDQAGNGLQAIRAAERLAALDPLREGAQRLLLRLLARHRGRDAALAQAEVLARLLREELDAEPEPATAALIEEIRKTAVDAAPVVPLPRSSGAAAAGPPVAADALVLRDAGSDAADAAAAGLSAANDDAPRARGRVFWNSRGTLAWGVAGALSLGLFLLSTLGRQDPAPPPTGGVRSGPSATAPAADDSWRPPSILSGASAANAGLADRGLHAVMVLPFSSDSQAPGPERQLADRITDDLINDLSRVPALRVIARQTSRLYNGRAVDVAAIGAELGVRYVVEGGLQLQDERVRINVALIDATTRLQVWAERFERDRADRFAAQDEMARAIARHLHVNVMLTEDMRRGPPRPGDPAVDELVAKGWAGIVRIFQEGAASGAEGYFEEVLRRQPNNLSAALGLAGYSLGIVGSFVTPDPEPLLRRADDMIARVLAVNPRSSMALYYRGILHKMRGEPKAALDDFAEVLAINPSFAPAYANAGHVMSRAGRLNEAMEHVRYAVRLSPKDPSLGNWSLYAGEIEFERGHDDAALEWLKRGAELSPRMPFNHAALAAVLASRGDMAAASRHVEQVKAIAPWLSLEQMLTRVTSMSQKGSEPHRLIAGLRRAFGERASSTPSAQRL